MTADDDAYFLSDPVDFEEYIKLIGQGTATEKHNMEFTLRVVQRFIDAVYERREVEPWILTYLADQFYKVLMGGRWEDELPLPWTRMSSPFSRAQQRGLAMFCQIENLRRGNPGMPITEIIGNVASEMHVSYETARAYYYKHKSCLSDSNPDSKKIE